MLVPRNSNSTVSKTVWYHPVLLEKKPPPVAAPTRSSARIAAAVNDSEVAEFLAWKESKVKKDQNASSSLQQKSFHPLQCWEPAPGEIVLETNGVLSHHQQVTPAPHCYDQTHSIAHDAWGVFLKLVGPLPNRVGYKNHDAVAIVCTACSSLFPPGIKRSMPPPTPPPPPGPQGPNGWYGNGGGGGMYGGGMYHGGAFAGSMFGNGGCASVGSLYFLS
jgi:hypothetical protein